MTHDAEVTHGVNTTASHEAAATQKASSKVYGLMQQVSRLQADRAST